MGKACEREREEVRWREKYLGGFGAVMQNEATQPKTILESVVDRAIQVLGNKDEALRWLNSPVRALNSATPLSLLDTPAVKKAVLTVLGRLEHGVL